MCDDKGREKGFKFCQIAAVVTEEGGAHTINLCKWCYKVRRLKQGEQEVTASTSRGLVEQKGFRGKLWAALDMEHFVRRMFERFTNKKAWARPVLADAEGERQNGADGPFWLKAPFPVQNLFCCREQ